MMLNLSLVGRTTEPRAFSYGWKDVVLYALGIGAKRAELDYLYEGRGPRVLPTFVVVPTLERVVACMREADVPLDAVIHGAQQIEVHRPIPPSGVFSTVARISAVYDLKRYAQVLVHTESTLEDGQPICETEWSILIRGAGKFQGNAPPRSEDVNVPTTPPDAVYEQTTLTEQALLYRLSGDHNPLHVDPAVANAAGFERGPILHGLATFGFAGRAIVDRVCAGDSTRLHAIRAQFKKPVWPGETLVTEMWRTESEKVLFRVKVKERDEIVISNAWARMR